MFHSILSISPLGYSPSNISLKSSKFRASQWEDFNTHSISLWSPGIVNLSFLVLFLTLPLGFFMWTNDGSGIYHHMLCSHNTISLHSSHRISHNILFSLLSKLVSNLFSALEILYSKFRAHFDKVTVLLSQLASSVNIHLYLYFYYMTQLHWPAVFK